MVAAAIVIQPFRHFLTLHERSLTQVAGLSPSVRSTANAGADQIVLYCAAEFVLATVHIRTGPDASAPRPATAPHGDGTSWTVVLDEVVPFTSGALALTPLESAEVPVGDLGLSRGRHRVVIATRGGPEAALLDDAYLERVEDDAPAAAPVLGPEEWLVDIHP